MDMIKLLQRHKYIEKSGKKKHLAHKSTILAEKALGKHEHIRARRAGCEGQPKAQGWTELTKVKNLVRIN